MTWLSIKRLLVFFTLIKEFIKFETKTISSLTSTTYLSTFVKKRVFKYVIDKINFSCDVVGIKIK